MQYIKIDDEINFKLCFKVPLDLKGILNILENLLSKLSYLCLDESLFYITNV